MARLAVWVALAAAVAVVVGCQPAKELPDELPKTVPAPDGPTVPTASEPAAKAYVEKAVKALTGGKPELLAKGHVSRAVLKGRQHKLNQPAPFDVTRTIAAVWPDRLADTDQIQSQGQTAIVSAYLHRPNLVVANNGVEFPPPNPIEFERTFTADEIAQHWMPLLLPVTDPRAVVFDLQSVTGTTPGTGQPLPIQLMKLSLGEFPIYQLTFNAKTDLLVRVEYSTTEQGVARRKQWTAMDHKPVADGLTLPSKTEFSQDVRLAEQFEVEKWEFPASINDAEFSPPKK